MAQQPAPTAPAFANPWLHTVLPNGCWAGQPCAIIGGGDSVPADLTPLQGMKVIGINRAYERTDVQCDVLFSMDTRFLNDVYEGKYKPATGAQLAPLEAFLHFRGIKAWLCTTVCRLPADVYVIKTCGNYEQSATAFSFDLEQGLGHGVNSGYGALNLAAALGANPIFLLGYDMQRIAGRCWWHGGHPNPMIGDQEMAQLLIPKFFCAAQKLRQRGFKVINLNPHSALRCFEFGTMDDLLAAKMGKG